MTQSGFAPVDSTQIYYEIHGEGHLQTLVMLHAGICDSRMWQSQVSYFAQIHRVITYDMRGFGKSPMGKTAYKSYQDLEALLDHLQVESVILMGCSYGGLISIDYTLAHPNKVRGLVLVGSGISGFEFTGEPHPLSAKIDEVYETGDMEQVSELEVQMWVDGIGRSPDQVDPDVRELVHKMNLIPLLVDETLWDMEEAPETQAIDRLETIEQPSLLIMGDLDIQSSQQRTNILEQRLPNARKVVMKSAAHVPNMEFPDEFNQTVSDFLKSI